MSKYLESKLIIFLEKVKLLLGYNNDINNPPYFSAVTKGYLRIKEKAIEKCQNKTENESIPVNFTDYDGMRTVLDMIRGQILYTDTTKMVEDINKIIETG